MRQRAEERGGAKTKRLKPLGSQKNPQVPHADAFLTGVVSTTLTSFLRCRAHRGCRASDFSSDDADDVHVHVITPPLTAALDLFCYEVYTQWGQHWLAER